jgi:single-strand DNA-binding protein
MLNRVELIGNLGADPEIRYTRHGMPVAHLSLATNETWIDREGTRQDRVLWHRVEVWGEMARTMEQHARKGQLVFIEGALRYNEWTDREGRTRLSASVSVAGSSARVRLLGRPARVPDAKTAADKVVASAQVPKADGLHEKLDTVS